MKPTIFAIIILMLIGHSLALAEGLKIAFIAPMNGPQAVFSAAARNGVEMALDEIRGETGLNAPSVSYQDSSAPNFNLENTFKTFSGGARPDLVVLVSRDLAEHAAKLSEAARVPLIAWSENSQITDKRPQVIRSWLPSGAENQILAQESSKRRYRNIFIVSSDAPGMLDMAVNLARRLPEGSVLARRQASTLRSDFREIIQEARSLKADTFALLLEPGQYAAFATQLKEARTTASIFASSLLYNREELRQAGFTLSGAWFSFIPVSERFERDYISRFVNESALSLAGAHYDLIMLLARATQPLDSSEALMTYLLSPLDRSGVTGNFRFSEEGGDRCLRAIPGIKQVTDEGFENL